PECGGQRASTANRACYNGGEPSRPRQTRRPMRTQNRRVRCSLTSSATSSRRSAMWIEDCRDVCWPERRPGLTPAEKAEFLAKWDAFCAEAKAAGCSLKEYAE